MKMRKWNRPPKKTFRTSSTNKQQENNKLFISRMIIESSPPIPTHVKQNSTDSSRQNFLSLKTNESSMNSPQMNKICSNTMTTKANNNEKSFVGYQSDRFEQTTQANKNCETMRKLEKVLKEKKLGAMIYEKMKTENNSTKNSTLRQIIQNSKSNKSQSFYQTKFLIPQPIHLLKAGNTNNNVSNSSFTRQNAKSFHQKNQSQVIKEKKNLNPTISPKKKFNEKTEKIESAIFLKSKLKEVEYQNENLCKLLMKDNIKDEFKDDAIDTLWEAKLYLERFRRNEEIEAKN